MTKCKVPRACDDKYNGFDPLLDAYKEDEEDGEKYEHFLPRYPEPDSNSHDDDDDHPLNRIWSTPCYPKDPDESDEDAVADSGDDGEVMEVASGDDAEASPVHVASCGQDESDDGAETAGQDESDDGVMTPENVVISSDGEIGDDELRPMALPGLIDMRLALGDLGPVGSAEHRKLVKGPKY